MTDFSVPQRMSFGAIVIYFLKYFKTLFNTFILIAIIGLIGTGATGEKLLRIAALIGLMVVLSIIMALWAYIKIRFYVENGNLIYRHKLIRTEVTTIPLDRIHTLRTRQGLLYRLLNLRGVFVDTLAFKDEEVELILSEPDWQSLLSRIECQEQTCSPEPDVTSAGSVQSMIRFSNKDLFLDALCQNHLKGMLVLGGLASVVLNHISDLSDDVIDVIENYIESQFADFIFTVASVAMVMVYAYVASLILWLGKTFLRYYDLRLNFDSRTLSFSHGMFSHMSSRFSYDKICTIWVKRNFFEKRFRFCTLALRQAGNTSAKKEEDNLKIYGRDYSGFFLRWWLGPDYGVETGIAAAQSGKGIFIRSLLTDFILSVAAITILVKLSLYTVIIIPAIYLIVGIPKGILKMRHSYIALKYTYLVVGSGRFASIRNYLKYGNIEAVRIKRTPMSRISGRVTLSLYTSGTSFDITSLREEEARNVYELLLTKSLESHSL